MSHGAGGKAMRDLIDQIFVKTFANEQLNALDDQARIPLHLFQAYGDRLAFTTDSYVVDPIFFPGGDIGSLAVNGTINDLAVGGAQPLYLSCSVILEEGMSIDALQLIACSMKQAADEAGVQIVTGDTKVVPRGKGDKVYINTTGIGVIPEGVELKPEKICATDKVIVSGYVGDHGTAILNARGDLSFNLDVKSDCQSLASLVSVMLDACPNIRAMRDATRGGVATLLNEFAERANLTLEIEEAQVPIRPEVKGICEVLGLNPLYFANEGTLIAVVPENSANGLIDAMRAHPSGKNAAIIGEALLAEPRVVVKTAFGSRRILDMLVSEQLPRIC